MKKGFSNIIFILLSFLSGTALGQDNCTVPAKPELTSVSVQPETGKTEFTWVPGETTDIAGYIVYVFSNGAGVAVDTVWDPAATSDVISNTAPKYSSVSYVVAAHRHSSVPGLPGCTSALSNVLSTIFCQVALDTCNRRINISWNSYQSYPRSVISYSLMYSIDGSSFTEKAVMGQEILNYTYDNFVTDANYCFYVRANLDGGYSSTSNKSCVLTKMLRPPDWINADYATVGQDNKISLSFTPDPASQFDRYQLERKSGKDAVFEKVAILHPNEGKVIYADGKASTGSINVYRLSAINSCDIPITVSNTASNIVLDVKREGHTLNLSWNRYREWLGSIAGYHIYLDTGNGFDEKATVPATDSTISLDYRDLMYQITGKQICMYILAEEISNPLVVNGQSQSLTVCTDLVELITVPNIFTPNGDLVNDLFRPVLSFTASSYHLIISDQHGAILFETRDQNESWDGTTSGGPHPDEVCLWFLETTTPSGKKLQRSGTVTLLRNP